MHSIENYEVLTQNQTGETLLSMDFDPALELEDGGAVGAVFRGLDLLVQAKTTFLIEDLPPDATEYLCEHGKIRLAEFGPGQIDRLSTLILIG